MEGKKLKVLFVGNSYTYYNDMPQNAFREIAEAKGFEATIHSVTSGGYRLCQFADPENEKGKLLRETVKGQKYHKAVLQEQSLNPIVNPSQFMDGVEKVMSLIDADEFILYSTWGRNDESEDLKKLGLNREEMTQKLSVAYNQAAKNHGAKVAEVGKAFLDYSKTQNKNDLYNPDHSHPSELGSAIAARVIFEKMTE